MSYDSNQHTIVEALWKSLGMHVSAQKSVQKWSQEESCSVEASVLRTPFGTTHRAAWHVLNRLAKLCGQSTSLMCLIEPSVQFCNAVFRRGEMLIACDQAFCNFAQSCDLAVAVVGASALLHVSVGRLLEELVLTHEKRLRQVVRLHGINTAHTIRNGRIRGHSALIVVVQDACAHDQMKCLSTAQFREASLVCNAAGLPTVQSLSQAQRESCQVREIAAVAGMSTHVPCS
jgi:hypothetical protein